MPGRGGLLRATVGLIVSLVALGLVVRTVDLEAAARVLASAQPAWIGLLVLLVATDLAVRGTRWRVLLLPIGRVAWRTTMAALLVGYLANNVLPARLGELVRVHVLGERAGLSRTTVLGTVVVERVLDTGAAVLIAAVAILALSVRGVVASAVLVGLALTTLLAAVVAAGIWAHRLPGASRIAAVVARWPRAVALLGRLREGLAVAGRPRTIGAAVALTAVSWTCAVLAYAAAAQAVGVQPTIGQAALVAAGTALATAIPSAPGYVGTFELAAVTIAASVGIAPESALAFAVLVHAVILLLTSVSGAIILVAGGVSVPLRTAVRPGPTVAVGRAESAGEQHEGSSTR